MGKKNAEAMLLKVGIQLLAILKPVKRRLLLLLSRFSRVRLCATPETAVHEAPLSLGFSRQEHWSGLPFSSLSKEARVVESKICFI